MQDTCFFC